MFTEIRKLTLLSADRCAHKSLPDAARNEYFGHAGKELASFILPMVFIICKAEEIFQNHTSYWPRPRPGRSTE